MPGIRKRSPLFIRPSVEHNPEHNPDHDEKFFYPRMSKGGVIISHDYVWFEGVRKAVDEFFADKPDPVFELAGSQCFIVRLR